MGQQYLSTDPNAGTPAPTEKLTGLLGHPKREPEASPYLSTDPNAGEPEPEPGMLSKLFGFATTSLVPGLSDSIRSRDAEAGFFDADVPLHRRLIEGATTPLGVAGELLPLLGILRAARPAAAAATALPGPPAVGAGTNLARNGQLIRSIPAAARGASTEAEFSRSLSEALDMLRAEGRPRGVELPPGPPQPAVSYPQLRPSRVTVPNAAAAAPPLAAPTVEAAATAKPHYTADQVLEFLRQRAAGADAPPPQGGSVIFDERLGPAPEAGRMTLPETRMDDTAFEAVKRALGIEESPLAATDDVARTGAPAVAAGLDTRVAPGGLDTANEASTMMGRPKLKLPEGTSLNPADRKVLDELGDAYRKADENLADVEKLFFENRTTSANLRDAKLARREAGKALRQKSLGVVKDAEDAIARGIKSEAGLAAPQLVQALAGGTIGGATGAALDEEDPFRGAVIGALAGALAPGTIGGTAKSLKTQGLSTVGKVYISGLLSGPMTMVRNVTSTAANGLFRMVSHPAAVAFDAVTSPAGKRTVMLNDITPAMIATWTGFKRGGTDALKTFVTGQSPYRGLFQGAPPMSELAGGLGNAINWPGRALDAFDTWLGRIVESQTVASRAYVEATNRGGSLANRWKLMGQLQANPSTALQAAADTEARRVLFRGDAGPLTEKMSELRTVLNKLPGKLPIGDFLIPFVRVPAMIARQAGEATPLGLLSDTSGMVGRQKTEHFARVFTGSLVMLKGAELAIEGRISGAGPSNPQQRAKLQEAGWRPYAVNVASLPVPLALALGGTKAEDGSFWIPTNALGPVGMAFGAIGDMAEGWKDSGGRDNATLESRLVETSGRLAHAVVDQTFLSDAVDLAEALDNPSLAQRYFQRKVQSAVPFSAALREGTRQTDPVVRDPHGAVESVKSIIPGLSTSVPARTDRFGQEVQRATAGAAPPRHSAAAVVEEAGAKLNKASGRISVTEPKLKAALEGAGFQFDENDQIVLTPSERRKLENARSQKTAEVLAQLRKSETYRALPADAQKAVIERLRRRLEGDRRMPELVDLLQQRRAGGAPAQSR